jgi:arylsulfatase A-like enzyme
MYDAGLATGFIMRWPAGGISGGRECRWLLSNVDFLPTLAELLVLEPEHRMEGVSFAGVFDAAASCDRGGPRDAVYAMWAETGEYAVRTEEYKLIRTFKARKPSEGDPGPYDLVSPVRLFYLPNDPYEERDVSNDPAHASALLEMNRRFFDWLDATNDPIRFGPTPTPYYLQAIADYTTSRRAE